MTGTPEGHGAVGRDLHAVEAHDDVIRLQVPRCVCYRADRAHHDAFLLGLHLVRLPAPHISGTHYTAFQYIIQIRMPMVET